MRSVALLLLPCLIIDPATAAGFQTPTSSVSTGRFNAEALSGRSIVDLRHPARLSPSVLALTLLGLSFIPAVHAQSSFQSSEAPKAAPTADTSAFRKWAEYKTNPDLYPFIGNKNPGVRAVVRERMEWMSQDGEFSRYVASYLTQFFSDLSPEDQQRAKTEAIDLLLRYGHGNPEYEMWIHAHRGEFAQLVRYGQAALPALIDFVGQPPASASDQNKRDAHAALVAVLRAGGEPALRTFYKQWTQDIKNTNSDLYRALKESGGQSAVDLVLSWMTEQSQRVTYEKDDVIPLLPLFQPDWAVPFLINHLDGFDDKAVQALVLIGNEHPDVVLPAVTRRIWAWDMWRPERERAAAVSVLVRIGSTPQGRQAMERLMNRDAHQPVEAYDTLGPKVESWAVGSRLAFEIARIFGAFTLMIGSIGWAVRRWKKGAIVPLLGVATTAAAIYAMFAYSDFGIAAFGFQVLWVNYLGAVVVYAIIGVAMLGVLMMLIDIDGPGYPSHSDQLFDAMFDGIGWVASRSVVIKGARFIGRWVARIGVFATAYAVVHYVILSLPVLSNGTPFNFAHPEWTLGIEGAAGLMALTAWRLRKNSLARAA